MQLLALLSLTRLPRRDAPTSMVARDNHPSTPSPAIHLPRGDRVSRHFITGLHVRATIECDSHVRPVTDVLVHWTGCCPVSCQGRTSRPWPPCKRIQQSGSAAVPLAELRDVAELIQDADAATGDPSAEVGRIGVVVVGNRYGSDDVIGLQF